MLTSQRVSYFYFARLWTIDIVLDGVQSSDFYMEGGEKDKNAVTAATTAVSFDTLELSEPTRNALKEMSFTNMTEIQVVSALVSICEFF